ncbi:SMI1/KNR4 family protein [Kordia sp.]|uniref:SMI1/KNR4 family protein n=1 Tax=Kordia sp. TaxID=1965332 RepID=UPI003B5AF2B8
MQLNLTYKALFFNQNRIRNIVFLCRILKFYYFTEHILQIKRIRRKLITVKSLDKDLAVFGATSHHYKLQPKISKLRVIAFEKEYAIRLPECYRSFLIHIGNGGAGPYQGLYELGHFDHFIEEATISYLNMETVLTPETTKKQWNSLYEEARTLKTDEAFENKKAAAYAGILFVAHCGCDSYLGIVLNGIHRGRLIRGYYDFFYAPSFFEAANFLDFYEDWLNDILDKKN